MQSSVLKVIHDGCFPEADGWRWLYRAFGAMAPRGSTSRRIICAYFTPTRLEQAGDGRVFRFLGVPAFGRVIPTGGITVRRISGARMRPYTLSAPTIGAARDFYYRACVFESLHLPFAVALLVITIDRFVAGQVDYALENMILNLVVNIYPMLHHRNTRRRILRLLVKGKGGSRNG